MGSRLVEVPVKVTLQNENIPAPVSKAPPVKQVPGVWKQPTGAGAWRPSPPDQMQTRAEDVSCTTRLRVPPSKGSFRSRAALAECASAGEKLFGTSAPLRYQEGRDVPSARRVYNATGEAVAQVWREMGIHQLWAAVQRSNFCKHGCQGNLPDALQSKMCRTTALLHMEHGEHGMFMGIRMSEAKEEAGLVDLQRRLSHETFFWKQLKATSPGC